MSNQTLYQVGHYLYRLRWFIIVLWVIIIFVCLPFMPQIMSPFKSTGFIDEYSNSAKIKHYLDKALGYNNYNTMMLIYHSKKLVATQPLYMKKIKQSLSELKNFPIQHQIILPDSHNRQISKDKHTAYVVVILKRIEPISRELVLQFKSYIKTPSNMSLLFGGQPIFIEAVNEQTQTDLYMADFIATPVAILTLVIVFGSIVAALLPILLGGICALVLLTALYFLGQIFTLSIFTLNIALLLGLCLCLDYALLMINRFREELVNGKSCSDAVAVMLATAGKAIFFSGIAVIASLSALLIFPVNILFSIGVGGVSAVVVAMLVSMILLPAVLAVLKTNINRFSIHLLRKNRQSSVTFWHWTATKIVCHPLIYGLSILILLLSLGYPFLSANFGISDYRIFPEHSEHRRFYDTYSEKFNERELTPILLVVQSMSNPILSQENLGRVYHLAHHLKENQLVKYINSIVTTKPSLTKKQYYTLYHQPKHLLDAKVKQLLNLTTRQYLTVLSIISRHQPNSSKTMELIDDLRQLKQPKGMNLQVTGVPVTQLDVLTSISNRLPYALVWIFASTYFIMFKLLRSVFLPIKAILMNLLSLSACFGALVLVFQDGYFHELLNFQPQGMVDISLLVIIFCALFGFSMDYEVFLLSRIKEYYDLTHDNEKSIVYGIEKSSRIITSAALIVIFICASFLIANVLMVKAFGLGIAVAIFVDAFLIRTILVPSTMMLLNQWNWYLPKWME